MLDMSWQVIFVAGLLASALEMSSAQLPSISFPHTEIVLAKAHFIDIGPPFDFYSIYRLTSTNDGTDVEKIAITPPAASCLQPATDVSHAHLQQSLDVLFDHKDPCTISEKALRREVKRCKHCLVFSGVHVTAQVHCGGKLRSIRYEVLDRDMFDPRPGTPQGTSRTMTLLSILDEAFGAGDFDRPVFPLEPLTTHIAPRSKTLQEVASGKYDNLFSGELISHFYRESQLPQKLPQVEIASSSPSAPI